MDESKLNKLAGKHNPFKIPDGYFEDFTEKLMERLPDSVVVPQEVTLWQRVKPWVYMAAMFGGLMFAIKSMQWISHRNDSPATNIAVNVKNIPEEELDPMVQQTLMDDYSLYEYVTEAK